MGLQRHTLTYRKLSRRPLVWSGQGKRNPRSAACADINNPQARNQNDEGNMEKKGGQRQSLLRDTEV